MSNIMLTKSCNLNCPYCFANKYVNKEKAHISMENFLTALEFITRTDSHVGLIGGEPTTHPHIKEILKTVINNPKVEHCTIYTNGIELDRIAEFMIHPKMSALVNLNKPSTLGENNYKRICNTLDKLYNTYYQTGSISLGINMYEPNFEYDYIIEICKRFNLGHLRVSVCVPNSDEYRNCSSLEWFRIMKPSVLKFFRDLITEGIAPRYDCNLMPSCILTPKELDWVQKAQQLIQANGFKTNIGTGCSNCSPVIDILPNLSVVRCFGMSQDLELNIRDFENLIELRGYLETRIDSFKFLVPTSEECKNCKSRVTAKCTGGCLAYKSNKLKEAYNLFEEGKYE